MNIQDLNNIARAMVAPGKGILAMDESTPTCDKRFKSLGIDTTEAKRREYRSLLLASPELSEYIGGAILFDETIRQKNLEDTPFPEHLQALGIVPGIKVDAGAKVLAGHPQEKVTEGLDGLRERLTEYFAMGARFAKWRAVITIGDGIPSRACIEANAHALARYAALCQEAGLVPIVEPEVLLDGSHSIERSFEVTVETQKTVFSELHRQSVVLEGIILKPSMVISGSECSKRAGIEEVAEQTIRCLKNTVPAAVPGIAFLSGGQSDAEATAHLNAMNSMGLDLPWALTFSYGRALQHAAMTTWGGDPANAEAASAVGLHRAKVNGAAARGQYTAAMDEA